MNNSIRMKVITGAVAATVILGGAGYLQSQQAFAAADSAAAAVTPSTGASADAAAPAEGRVRGHRGMMGGKGGGSLIGSTAEILGVEASDIMTQLKDGKTFAQIAEASGLSKADYLAKLIAAETARIDEKLAAGSITEEQAAAKKTALTGELTQAIEANAEALRGRGHGGRGGLGGPGFGRFSSSEEIAATVGLTEDELKAALESGQSLAEVAAAQGISEDDLIAKLKEAMTDELKTFVNEKRTAKPAPAAQEEAAAAAETA